MKKISLKNLLSVICPLLVSPCVYAVDATPINTVQKQFTAANSQQELMATANSFYDLTMGGSGWVHNSAWLYMKLKKDVQYTVNATADQSAAGFHPGLACFYRPQGAGLVGIEYMYDHMYSQYNSHVEKNMVEEVTKRKLGTFKSYFIVNGYDRDGMENPLPVEYQQGTVIGMVDVGKNSKPGSVTLSFVPEKSGYYQCVMGGINPDVGLDLRSKYKVTVTVFGL